MIASVVAGMGRLALLLAILAAPWLFGAVQPEVQFWLFGAVAVALGCGLIASWSVHHQQMALPPAIVILVLAVGLGIGQTLPLPADWQARLSPAGTALRSALTQDANGPNGTSQAHAPISLSPIATRRDVGLLMLATAAFLLGGMLFATPGWRLALLILVAVNGAAFGFFGLVQKLTWNGKIYWSIPLTSGGGPFAAFVNRNNAGGFLNLCLAGAIGWLLWAWLRNERVPHWNSGWRAWAARIDANVLLATGAVTIIGTAILATGSRGASLAMMAGGLLTAMFVPRSRFRVRGWWLLPVLIGPLLLIIWVGVAPAVQARLGSLLNRSVLAQARWPHWQDGLRAVPDFWPSGSGLGTYRHVYPLYQQRFDERWFYHAENQYLEALVEMGLPGLSLLLAMIVVMFLTCRRLMARSVLADDFAFGVAALLALFGQVIHAGFDFALYLPANFLLFAMICGAASGRAAALAPQRSGSRPAVGRVHPVGVALATLLIAGLIVAGREASHVVAAESIAKHSAPPDAAAELEQQITALEALCRSRHADAETHARLASLWIDLYRSRAVEQLPDVPAAEARRLVSPLVLHRRAHEFAAKGFDYNLTRLLEHPIVQAHLPRAVDHLLVARQLCPLLPRVHLRLAELAFLTGEPSADANHLERLRRLVPSDPDLLFRCGLLEHQAGRLDLARHDWQQSLALAPRHLPTLIQMARAEHWPVQNVVDWLPDVPEVLAEFAERWGTEAQSPIAERLLQLADRVDLPAEERCVWRAKAFRWQDQLELAAEELQAAVTLRPDRIDWRHELVLLLLETKNFDQAQEQARICAQLAPHDRAYTELLRSTIHERLTALPER